MRVNASKARTTLPRIIDAAIELFVEKGVEGTTTRDIAKRAGVAEGGLYRHYRSKDELAHAIYRDNLSELSAALFHVVLPKNSLRKNLLALIETIYTKYEEEPLLAQYVLFAQFRESPKLPEDFRWPSEAFETAIRMGRSTKTAGRDDKETVVLKTAMVFGAVVRPMVFRQYGELSDLRTHIEEVTNGCLSLLKK